MSNEFARETDSWKGRKVCCFRCGHQWISRSDERPVSCPSCRSRRFDVPSKEHKCFNCGAEWAPKHSSDICPGCGSSVSDIGVSRGFSCNQCGHRWVSRGSEKPVKCPRCKSRNWDEPKIPRFTCRKCGYVWKSKMEHPEQCPKCRSRSWDKDTFKLKCFRCGHKWILTEGVEPNAVKTCPSCRSMKWDELPPKSECFRCGRMFIQFKRNSLCPICKGEDHSEFRCGFCGAEWVASADAKKICPACGLVFSDDESEKLIVLWEKDGLRLVYLFKDGIGCVYLWEGSYPISCRYMDELLDEKGLEFATIVRHAGNERYGRFWDSLTEDMMSRRDSYRENIPYFMDRLGLNEGQAEILALHFTGMSPETIALRLGRSLRDIRSEFTRIQNAFSRGGIVVNDSVYTEDPISCYEDEQRDTT
ncbi:hypothetical protein PED39_02010 [Methanomassiliicoccales archaeon LGM-RCC1]|nr:hypothetical protein PED39_02010 [Methanomassiliicoccales archaeon LGM-RCC1]